MARLGHRPQALAQQPVHLRLAAEEESGVLLLEHLWPKLALPIASNVLSILPDKRTLRNKRDRTIIEFLKSLSRLTGAVPNPARYCW